MLTSTQTFNFPKSEEYAEYRDVYQVTFNSNAFFEIKNFFGNDPVQAAIGGATDQFSIKTGTSGLEINDVEIGRSEGIRTFDINGINYKVINDKFQTLIQVDGPITEQIGLNFNGAGAISSFVVITPDGNRFQSLTPGKLPSRSELIEKSSFKPLIEAAIATTEVPTTTTEMNNSSANATDTPPIDPTIAPTSPPVVGNATDAPPTLAPTPDPASPPVIVNNSSVGNTTISTAEPPKNQNHTTARTPPGTNSATTKPFDPGQTRPPSQPTTPGIAGNNTNIAIGAGLVLSPAIIGVVVGSVAMGTLLLGSLIYQKIKARTGHAAIEPDNIIPMMDNPAAVPQENQDHTPAVETNPQRAHADWDPSHYNIEQQQNDSRWDDTYATGNGQNYNSSRSIEQEPWNESEYALGALQPQGNNPERSINLLSELSGQTNTDEIIYEDTFYELPPRIPPRHLDRYPSQPEPLPTESDVYETPFLQNYSHPNPPEPNPNPDQDGNQQLKPKPRHRQKL